MAPFTSRSARKLTCRVCNFLSSDNDDYLRFETDFLKGSRFEQDVDVMANVFDKRTKHSFRNPGDNYVLRFGTMHDTDAKFNIKNGQLRIRG